MEDSWFTVTAIDNSTFAISEYGRGNRCIPFCYWEHTELH